MCDSEKSTEDDADTADNYVCDTKEGISATHDGSCTDNDRFGTSVFGNVEDCTY
jgi:hypothetical protein